MECYVAYPYGTQSNVIEPLDLEDVKSYMSIREEDTTQDAFLQDAIPMCRATLEQHLPFYVITGTVRAFATFKPSQMSDKTIIKVKGPISPLTQTVTATAKQMEDEAVSVTVSIIDQETVSVDLSGFDDMTRVDITYHVGSAVDQRVRAILLTMIRNRYDRRYEDPYTEEVRRMAYPLMRINI